MVPEKIAEDGGPIRLLAVPMVVDNRTRGIICLLRGQDGAPFTTTEQETLQHFSHLLGLAMHSAWRLFLSRHIMEADTEPICITRNEIVAGQTIPRVVYADHGSELLFNLSKEKLDGFDARKLYAKGEYAKTRARLDAALKKGSTACGPFRTKGIKFGRSRHHSGRSVEPHGKLSNMKVGR